MSNFLDNILEQLKSYLESEEGKADIKKEQERIKFRKEHIEKYIEYLHNLSISDRTALFEKIKAKYDSQEYYDREVKLLKREPREFLYDYIFEYGHKYGVVNEIPDAMFGYDSYIIDGIWVFTAWYGQGTAYNFDKLLIL